MEFGLREYLLILGGLLIVGLLVDGIRRTLRHRRQGLKLDLMAAPPELPEYAEVSPPRLAKRSVTPQSLEPDINHDPLFHDDEQGQLALWSVEIKPSTVKSKVDPESVLAEPASPAPRAKPVTPSTSRGRSVPSERVEPVFDEPLFAEADPVMQASIDRASEVDTVDQGVKDANEQPLSAGGLDEAILVETPEDRLTEIDVEPPEDRHTTDMAILADASSHSIHAEAGKSVGGVSMVMSRLFQKFAPRSHVDEPIESPDLDDGIVSPARPARRSDGEAQTHVSGASSSATADSPGSEVTLDDLVLLRLRAARAEHFADLDLHTACLRVGLRFTADQVYSRYPLDDTQPPLFTLVNGIEPGIFESEARVIETPLLVLFSVLKDQSDPVFAVTEMVTGARAIARTIGGEVLNDQDEPITREWIDLARARAGHLSLTR
jgi:cell division protein ZipA